MSALVLDTNIVLDLLLFQNPQAQGLRQALDQQQLQWLATVPMREELARVLAYPKIAAVLARLDHNMATLLMQWDA
jgi:predicted nucleic acid-binding protein